MKAPTVDLSIIVPCYNEEEALPFLWTELQKVRASMPAVSIEFVFIDDGSVDATRERIREFALSDAAVRYVFFSRNFGKEAALLAGLEASRGDTAVTMDADLQDPPSLVKPMYEAVASKSCDCAATRRVNRKGEPFLRSVFSRLFYRLMAKISDAHMADGTRDFRLMSRRMIDAILSLKEYNRFSKGIFSWVGFKTKWFEFENVERVAGKTKWSFWQLFFYSLEGITAFSTVPLVLASIAGIFCFFMAFVLITVVVIKTLLWGDPVAGYPSLMSAILFIGGIQLFAIGILGQYISKIYLETKKRPVYIIGERSDD